MTGMIFAILTCTNQYCLDNYPIRFRSAEVCVDWMKKNMAQGQELIHGRAYANNEHSVWLECDGKPISEWQAVTR